MSDLTYRRSRNVTEQLIGGVLFLCAAASTLVTLGVVVVLLRETIAFFGEVSIVDFLTDTRWEPMFQEKHFGVMPLLAGSFMVAGGAAVIALPVGLLTAIFLAATGSSPAFRSALSSSRPQSVPAR